MPVGAGGYRTAGNGMNCATCKHWHADSRNPQVCITLPGPPKPPAGLAPSLVTDWFRIHSQGYRIWFNRPGTYGECGAIGNEDEFDETTLLAYTWDYEGFSSGFTTESQFGCKLWEAND